MKRPASAAGLFIEILGRHRLLVTASILAALGWQAGILLAPIVLGWIIDGIESHDRTVVLVGAGLILLLGAGEAVFDGLRHYVENRAAAEIAANLRERVVASALTFDEDGQERFPPGETVARLTSDADAVADLFDAIGYTLAYILTVPVVLVILFFIDPLLGGAVLLTAVVTGLGFWRSSGVWERRSSAVQEAIGSMTARAMETVEGFKAIRSLGAEASIVGRFAQDSQSVRDAAKSNASLWLIFGPLLDVLAVSSVAVVLWVAGAGILNDRILLGEAVTAIGLALFMVIPVRAVGERALSIQMALASSRRLAELLSAAKPPRAESKAGALAGRGLSLELSEVDVQFADGRGPLVANASVTLLPGQAVFLDGPTGSGKTTLLRVLAGWRNPSRGSVMFRGQPLGQWPGSELRRRILLVNQTPDILSGTIADNLRLASATITAQEMTRALELVRASELAKDEEALLRPVGERGRLLSGGQRQRLALARAIVARPEVLLLDGATNGLEPSRELSVLQNITAEWADGIVVMVTPNPAAALLSTTHLHLDEAELQVMA